MINFVNDQLRYLSNLDYIDSGIKAEKMFYKITNSGIEYYKTRQI